MPQELCGLGVPKSSTTLKTEDTENLIQMFLSAEIIQVNKWTNFIYFIFNLQEYYNVNKHKW